MFDQKIICFSDVHCVEPGEHIIGLDPVARFERGLAHALSVHPDADRVLIVGDLTHHGRIAQYERLARALAAVEIPVHLTLGNHDRRDAFRDVFGGAGFAQEVVDLGAMRLITLDTLDGPPYPDGHHAGRLCEERLEWLEVQLRGDARPVVLAFHHPPYDVGFPGMDRIKLQNPDDLSAVLERSGSVAHLINGHVHRTISGQWRGIPYAMFKSPAHQMPMLMAGTKSSSSTDEPGAYGIICTSGTDITIHTEDFDLAGTAQDDTYSS